jgi:S-adenosylmethionine decarboxylase
MTPLGTHTLAELEGADAQRLNDVRFLRTVLVRSIRAAGGTVVRTTFHRFQPQGVSGVVVIAESHVTLHTWPEHGAAAVDVFSCTGRLDHAAVIRDLATALIAVRVRRRTLRRGVAPTRPARTPAR